MVRKLRVVASAEAPWVEVRCCYFVLNFIVEVTDTFSADARAWVH